MQLASVEVLDEIDSTNDRAIRLAADVNTRVPLLIQARRQSAGRGRGANRWWADDGALTFSLLLDPDEHGIPAARWPRLSLTTGLAVCRAIEPFLSPGEARLKWPNDVYVRGRKACGILVEIPPVRPPRVVIGVGLNVNNSLEHAPDEVRARACSLADLTGAAHELNDVLANVLRELSTALSQLAADDSSLVEESNARCCLRGRTIHLDTPGGVIVGVATGIDREGAIELRTESGATRCLAGVVTRIE